MDAAIVAVAQYLYLVPVVLFVLYGLATRRKKEFFLFSLFVLPTSYLLGLLAGHLFYDPRPFVADPSVIPLFSHAPDNGFPSDHALLTGTLAAIVSAFNAPLAALLWLLALLVGGARVLAHVHHALDIAGSFVIAAFSAIAVGALFFRSRKAPPPENAGA